MLVAFAVLAAIFVALDTAAGVNIRTPQLLAATSATHTPTPSATTIAPSPTSAVTGTPGATPFAASATPASGAPSATPGATAPATPAPDTTPATAPPNASATSILPPTGTATPMPTPPGGVTPPRYGTLTNYVNNTSFSVAFMQTLDERIIALTNQERASHNLPALGESEALDVIAAARSQDMVQRSYFDHYDPTGPIDAQGRHAAAVVELLDRNNIPYTEVGENLIGNTGFPLDDTTPRQVVNAWMHHPEHRANILHAGYTTIGVGMAAQNEQNTLRVVITQIFVH